MLATFKRFATLAAFAALLSMAPLLVADVRADDEPVKITIRATDAGFEPNTIEVEQGSLVELTFIWDHASWLEEQHIVVFNDYKIESNQIDFENRETIMKFVATESGTFTFKCDLECDLHDYLQHGELIVVRSEGGGAAALTATTLTIQPTGVSVRGDTVGVIASLLDDEGNPVPKAELRFFLEETFVNTTSLVEIAVTETNETGLARITYQPTHGRASNLTVQFAGAGIFDAAETVVEVRGSSAFGPGENQEPERLAALRSAAPGGLLLVILGIWATFAFALYKVWAVSRIKSEGGET